MSSLIAKHRSPPCTQADFFIDDAQNDYQRVQGHDENKPELSHEILAGGASFIAMKEWEDHQRAEGKSLRAINSCQPDREQY